MLFFFLSKAQCQQSAVIPHTLSLRFNDSKALASCTKSHLLQQSHISMLMHLAAKVLTHRLADSPSRATEATVRFGNELFTSCNMELIQQQIDFIQCYKSTMQRFT